MIKKKGAHLSHKEISPTKFKEQFLDRIKECLESDIKERNNKKRKTIIYHSETILNYNDKSYELSDISSLNLSQRSRLLVLIPVIKILLVLNVLLDKLESMNFVR